MTEPIHADTPVYEERCGWTARPIVGASLTLVLLAGGLILELVVGVWQPIAIGALLAVVVYPVVRGAVTHAPAFRADETGITLHGAPRTTRPGPTLTPWSAIEEIKLVPAYNRRSGRSGSAVYVRATSDVIDDKLPSLEWWPQVPGRVLAITNFRIDLEQLGTITSHYAPTVKIVDEP